MTRWGKFRPFFLFGSLPLLLLSVATFTVPGGLGGTGKLIYAYATYALLGLAYSLVNIPYGSLASAMTQEPEERAKLASFRSMGTAATILAARVHRRAADQERDDLQQSLTLTTLLFVVIGFGLYMLLLRHLEGARGPRRGARQPPAEHGTLKGNRPLLMLCLSALLVPGRHVHPADRPGVLRPRRARRRQLLHHPDRRQHGRDVRRRRLHRPGSCGPSARSRPTSPAARSPIVAARRHRADALDPPGLAIACFGALGVGLGAVNTLMWALEADTVEYGEWRTGVRTEGTTYAVFSFTRKVGQAVGGAAAAFTIGIGGYVSARRAKATRPSRRSGSRPASYRRSPSRPRSRS